MSPSKVVIPKSEKLEVFIREGRYKGSLPNFFSTDLFPELRPLQDNWQAIREEVLAFEKNHGEMKGISSNSYVSAQFEGINWSNLYLDNFMWRFHKNRRHFPLICSLVDQIPNCTLTVLTVLSPNSSVKPHFGDTNGIVRCQLGLIIPAEYPTCGIRVGDEEKGWSNGEFIAFTEAHLHCVWNKSLAKRYLLIVDLKSPFVSGSKMEVCSKVLGAQSFNYLEARFPIVKNLSKTLANIVCVLLSFAWKIYLPVQRKIKFL